MTNKQFQEYLAQFPDDYQVSVDTTFPWCIPASENKKDPYLYVNTDFGIIEIETKELPEMNMETIKKVLGCFFDNTICCLNEEQRKQYIETTFASFKEKYENA